MPDGDPSRSRRIGFSLDALNFLAADVRNAFGPYINLLLVTDQHWSLSQVGVVTSVSGLIGIALQTPIGAAIDVSRAKRGVIAFAMAVMGVCALIIYSLPSFWPMALATSLLSVAGDAFVPAVAAVTLGLVARKQLARRLGRNSAFDHAGNIAIAIVAGAVGYLFSQRTVFLLVPFFAAATIAATFSIPADAIDHDRARDLAHDGVTGQGAEGYGVLFRNRRLLIFAISVALFQFANGPLMPLAAQKLAYAHPNEATAMMSLCVVVAQGVMVPIAILVGRKADQWGRKPLFLAAFIALPIRAFLYTLSDDPFWVLGVQLLDGLAAGIFQALSPLIIADIMRGTGRYNLAQGAVGTVQGIGASLSGLAAGEVVDRFGYDAGFIGLGLVAALALAVFAVAMPETGESNLGAAVENGE